MNKEVVFFLIIIGLVLLFSFQDLWSGGIVASLKDAFDSVMSGTGK